MKDWNDDTYPQFIEPSFVTVPFTLSYIKMEFTITYPHCVPCECEFQTSDEWKEHSLKSAECFQDFLHRS